MTTIRPGSLNASNLRATARPDAVRETEEAAPAVAESDVRARLTAMEPASAPDSAASAHRPAGFGGGRIPALAVLSAQAELDAPRFGALAKEKLGERYETLMRGLLELGEHTLPHEARLARKQLGRFRAHLDVFAGAFPLGEGKDAWRALRKSVDEGYELLGAFKDLADEQGITLATQDPQTGEWSEGIRPEDVAYKGSEVKKARKKVLRWLEDATSVKARERYQDMYGALLDDTVAVRDKDRQSRFYWGGVDATPDAGLSGVENVSVLVHELLMNAVDAYSRVIKFDEVRGKEEPIFHDFRKQVRAVEELLPEVPEVLPREPGRRAEAEALAGFLTELVDGYGDVNDQLLAMHHAERRGQAKRRKTLKSAVDDAWQDLARWQRESDAGAKLLRLAFLLRQG